MFAVQAQVQVQQHWVVRLLSFAQKYWSLLVTMARMAAQLHLRATVSPAFLHLYPGHLWEMRAVLAHSATAACQRGLASRHEMAWHLLPLAAQQDSHGQAVEQDYAQSQVPQVPLP